VVTDQKPNKKTIFFSLPMQVFMIHNIKTPAMEAVETIFSPDKSKMDKLKATRQLWKVYQAMQKLPEPTLENTWHPNTHNLIRLRDWLFERCFLGKLRMGFIRKVMNFAIILYDFDPPWRWIFDNLKDEALKMEWKPKGYEDDWTYKWWRD